MVEIKCWLLVVVIAVIGCRGNEVQNQEDIAALICQCSEKLQEFNDQVDLLQKEGDVEGFTNAISNGSQIRKTALECIRSNVDEDALRMHYNVLLKDEIEEQCQRSKIMIDDIYTELSKL